MKSKSHDFGVTYIEICILTVQSFDKTFCYKMHCFAFLGEHIAEM